MFRKLTPVIAVESIEPCLPLWLHRLGFEKPVEVPEGDRLGFVILQKDGVELMYQTRTSILADAGFDIPPGVPATSLFIEVESLDQIINMLGDYPVALPRRQTFYGMDEIGVRDAAGTLVIFACPLPGAAQ